MWHPEPGWLIVRPVLTEEALGSIIVPPMVRDAMTRTQYEVVAVGDPPVEDEEDPGTPYDFQVGDWVIVPPRMSLDVMEEDLRLVGQSQVWGVIGE